jgi:hypothetical protein
MKSWENQPIWAEKTGRKSGPGIAATATEIPAAAAEDAMVVKRDQWLGGGTSDFYEIS